MPQGSCVKVRPSRPRCERTAVAGPARVGGQVAYAPAGRGAGWRAAWGQRVPTPLAGRCAPWLDAWSFTGRAVCRAGTGSGRVLPPLSARP